MVQTESIHVKDLGLFNKAAHTGYLLHAWHIGSIKQILMPGYLEFLLTPGSLFSSHGLWGPGINFKKGKACLASRIVDFINIVVSIWLT